MEIPKDRALELVLTGRAGIDLNTTQPGNRFSFIPYFTKSVGGSPANIVQGAARLGLKTGFLGKVAWDGMGEFIVDTFRAQGIDTAGMVFDRTGARNCIAVTEIVSPQESGSYRSDGSTAHHGTYLYNSGTADTLYTPEEINTSLLASAKAVLLSGSAFSQQPSRDTMFEILRLAKKFGVLTVLDVDFRPTGWNSPEETAYYYTKILPDCQIVIGNREEFNAVEYCSMPENRDNETSARALLHMGVEFVVVKDGPRGSTGYTASGDVIRCGVIPTKAVKTFGSGDAYAAGLMYGILREKGYDYALQLGTACASLALTTVSCGDAMPDFETAEHHRVLHQREMMP